MKEILNKINESGLTPNQYFLLYALDNKINLSCLGSSAQVDYKTLEDLGHIIDGAVVTNLFDEEKEGAGFHMKCVRFAQHFPPIYIPGTTIHARGKIFPLKAKLKAFIKSYTYDWDVIYQATENYVKRFENNGYAYMLCASTFIFDKNGDSTLALECDTLEYNRDTEEVAL